MNNLLLLLRDHIYKNNNIIIKFTDPFFLQTSSKKLYILWLKSWNNFSIFYLLIYKLCPTMLLHENQYIVVYYSDTSNMNMMMMINVALWYLSTTIFFPL